MTVPGAETSVSTIDSPISTLATASTTAQNSDHSIALVTALCALVIALVALLMGRGGRGAATNPAEEWSAESPPPESVGASETVRTPRTGTRM